MSDRQASDKRIEDLGELHDKLATLLLDKVKAKDITAVEMRVALDLIKHNQVDGGNSDRPDNPATELRENMPFPTMGEVDQETPARQLTT